MIVVVSYDIVDDSRRTRLAQLCLDYGRRVQKSVYECSMDDKKLGELQGKVAKLIDMSVDSVRYYSLCKKCYFAIEVQGIGTVTDDDPHDPVIL